MGSPQTLPSTSSSSRTCSPYEWQSSGDLQLTSHLQNATTEMSQPLQDRTVASHLRTGLMSTGREVAAYVARRQRRLARRQALYDVLESGHGLLEESSYDEDFDKRDIPFLSCEDLTQYM
eukprot:CAMPEP_0117648604 /NCGR_PEP_ID=MMETSP0804-20121206/502_1 /TAXON_ID=1074897 /ORGANISM="Tetraselmis astigmatica, Strain CCMP880" /LENGTH=119 /DNA_ID=CAMNT_0005454235 /DNA_START=125 /DNA_END=484 /DNA_ORIENTATION=+